MSKVCVLFAVVALFLGAGQVRAEDWVQYATSAENTFYFDKENLARPDQAVVRVWTRRVPLNEEQRQRFIEGKTDSGDQDLPAKDYSDYAYSTTLWELKCRARVIAAIFLVHHASEGTNIDSFYYRKPAWKNFQSNSVIEDLFKAVCPKESRR
jgi:hypothetical protein